jgi:hypothetical protein
VPTKARKLPSDVRSLARAYTDVSIQTLGNYVSGPQTEPEIKLRAIALLLERGWGRPAQQIEHTGKDGDNEIRILLRTITEGKK